MLGTLCVLVRYLKLFLLAIVLVNAQAELQSGHSETTRNGAGRQVEHAN